MPATYFFGTAGLHRLVWPSARRGLLRLAFETGFRDFDTAPLYGNGLAEAEIGATLGTVRRQIRLTTKFGIPVSLYGAARPWTFMGERALRMVLDPGYRARFDRRDWSVRQMRSDLEGSLKRMRTDHVERFCLHEPLDLLPDGVWDDLASAAQDLKRAGKIGQFGISGEQPCMAALAVRPGLDFVQTRIGTALHGFDGPIFAYGLFGQFRASGQGDFNAYLRGGPGGPGVAAHLLSSTKPDAVKAYRPLFG